MDQLSKKLNACDLAGQETKPKLGLQPLAPKLEKNPNGTKVTVATNLKKIILAPNMSMYKYAVNVLCYYRQEDGKEVEVDLTTFRCNAQARERNKDHCQKAFSLAVCQCAALNAGGATFYDRQASLYSLTNLALKGDVRVDLTEGVSASANFIRTTIVIKAVGEKYQCTSNDLKKIANACPALADKTLPEAISIMLSAPAYSNPNVITVGNCVHYILDTQGIDCFKELFVDAGGMYSSLGVSKGVKCLEGSDKSSPSLYMSTEMKVTLFHPDNANVLELMKTYESFNNQLRADSSSGIQISNAFKGLEVFIVTNKNITDFSDCMIHKITGFSTSANNTTFLLDNKPTTVAKYFSQKYNIQLQYPDVMTATARGRNGLKINLPVELLYLCPSQKVTNDRMGRKVQADMIKMSAARPAARMNGTEEVARRARIGMDTLSGCLKVERPEQVQAIVLEKPKISFAGNAFVKFDPTAQTPTDFKKTGGFVQAKKLSNWEIIFAKDMFVKGVEQHLMQEMKSNGMTVSVPVISTLPPGENFHALFEKAKQNKRELLMFILPSNTTHHARIKALEQHYDVLTQELHVETANKVAYQSQTRQNIVNKMNMKLGGLNYLISSPALKNPNIFLIGFESSSKGGNGDGPVSIGFAANMLDHPQKFAGGYIYAKRDRDIYGDVIEKALGDIFSVAKFSGRGKPEELVIYFNGITEGQYSIVNEIYVPKIKKACANVSKTFEPAITVIASSKTHNERFFATGKRVENVVPGTVIDHTIVSPVLSEFYLTSAVARQGTAKAVKFTLLHASKPDKTLERLEILTNDLAYDHQIVFQPVGLPVPLFIAGRYSQRGAAVLGVRGDTKNKTGDVDYDATNEALGYGKKRLFTTRFNA